MATVKEIMTPGVECVGENDTLVEAAKRMKELDVGSLPICGEDQKLHGMLTDRDIVVGCIADGGDPGATTAGQLAKGTPVWVSADAPAGEALKRMAQAKVRRLPVIENGQLVGIVSQADVAKQLPEDEVGSLVELISSGS
jgi:CBS domain-containing protein